MSLTWSETLKTGFAGNRAHIRFNYTFMAQAKLKNLLFKDLYRTFLVLEQALFKANLIFRDSSRKPSIFKYFSSLCELCNLMGLNFAAVIHCRSKNMVETKDGPVTYY